MKKSTIALAVALLVLLLLVPPLLKNYGIYLFTYWLVFVLAVQFDEVADEGAQRRGVHELAVDEGAGASLGGDLAPHDEVAAVRGFELGFDAGGVFAGAHEIRGRAPAEQKPHGLDQHRLSGAGLARQDVERAFKFDGGRLDDRKVLDRQIPDHRRVARGRPRA